jgi:hypothetical protein
VLVAVLWATPAGVFRLWSFPQPKPEHQQMTRQTLTSAPGTTFPLEMRFNPDDKLKGACDGSLR